MSKWMIIAIFIILMCFLIAVIGAFIANFLLVFISFIVIGVVIFWLGFLGWGEDNLPANAFRPLAEGNEGFTHCRYCGDVSEDSKYCTKCGAKLS